MTDILDMGAHASFVWSSFALGLAVFAWNAVAPLLQRKALLERLTAAEEERAS